MDGNGFPSAPQRGPLSGPVPPPISIPLTALRSTPITTAPPVVTLSAPRPETERRDNEYVETPLRGTLPPSSPLSTHRPPAPTPPPPISKQPISSFSKTSASAAASSMAAPSCGSRASIICPTCGRCKCATCRTPKALPQCWSCNGCCLVSADSLVDYASCLCCAKGLFYHCSESDDVDSSCADDPCGCGPERRAGRWSCLAALACVLPCLVLYWPLRGAKRAVELCYERHSRSGCRCRPPKQPSRPPAKRLLANESSQDF